MALNSIIWFVFSIVWLVLVEIKAGGKSENIWDAIGKSIGVLLVLCLITAICGM